MDKIETIREKIESLLNDWKFGSSIEAKYRCEVYRELLEDINSLQEEPVSEELEAEIQRYYVDWDEHPEYVQTARHFAKWQKQQDQETIELAEDHAMLAGMEKLREQMMKDAVGGMWIRRNKHTKKNVLQCFDVTHEVFQKFKDGDRIKMLILKDE